MEEEYWNHMTKEPQKAFTICLIDKMSKIYLKDTIVIEPKSKSQVRCPMQDVEQHSLAIQAKAREDSGYI